MSLKGLSLTYRNRLNNVLGSVGSGGRAINIGCGDGEYNNRISERFGHVIGIDISKNDIKTANRKKSMNESYLIGNAVFLPFAARVFDTVLCIDVLEHIPDDEMALKEMWRIMKKNGTLILSVPQIKYPFTYDPINYILEKTGKKIHIGAWGFGHSRLYDIDKLIKKIEENKLKVVEVKYLSHYIVGAFENYLSTLLQPLAKKKSRNFKAGQPGILKYIEFILDLVCYLDSRLFPSSNISVSVLFYCKKT